MRIELIVLIMVCFTNLLSLFDLCLMDMFYYRNVVAQERVTNENANTDIR